jgi:hypothetical protein
MSNPKLPAISPVKMEITQSTPEAKSAQAVQAIPGAPKKNTGTIYPLPALAAAKVEGVVKPTNILKCSFFATDVHLSKNLDNEFVMALPTVASLPQIIVPKLVLPGGKFIEPEDIEKLPPVEPEDEELYADWYERQVKEFKEDMREEARWR